mmetsp:Transcript_50190/g.106881  ORF Transcript_50190/g.106881 Transcript_50190/m.106881 type:complete len:282 (+) Transcript_50190:84-929(+)
MSLKFTNGFLREFQRSCGANQLPTLFLLIHASTSDAQTHPLLLLLRCFIGSSRGGPLGYSAAAAEPDPVRAEAAAPGSSGGAAARTVPVPAPAAVLAASPAALLAASPAAAPVPAAAVPADSAQADTAPPAQVDPAAAASAWVGRPCRRPTGSAPADASGHPPAHRRRAGGEGSTPAGARTPADLSALLPAVAVAAGTGTPGDTALLGEEGRRALPDAVTDNLGGTAPGAVRPWARPGLPAGALQSDPPGRPAGGPRTGRGGILLPVDRAGRDRRVRRCSP